MMNSVKQYFRTSPWRLVKFFIPITALAPLAIFCTTLFKGVYPGKTAYLTATAARLCGTSSLANPIFQLMSRLVADLQFGSITTRLNLLCACCGSIAIALFYLLVARLVFLFACEDSDGAMAAMPPQEDDYDGDGSGNAAASLAQNPDGTLEIPEAVKTHNWHVACAATLGGLAAAVALAFSAPFWLASTRLYPYTLDLMLLFIILNLLLSYTQQQSWLSLFSCIFLLGVCILESPLFLGLAPIGGFLLLRALRMSEQTTTYCVLGVALVGLLGVVVAIVVLWDIARYCALLPVVTPRDLLHTWQVTLMAEAAAWIPVSGWSRIFVQLLVPCALAPFVLAFAFTWRTLMTFLLQLGVIACFVPSLLNLSFAPWGIARVSSRMPVYTYVIIALLTGLVVAAWNLMRESAHKQPEDDLDYYGHRDSPFISMTGARLCWPLLLLVLTVPFFSFPDIDPEDGKFADRVADRIYADFSGREWLINSSILRNYIRALPEKRKAPASDVGLEHHLMLRALADGCQLRFLDTDPTPDQMADIALTRDIMEEPAFAQNRYRILNAADLAPSAFLREWLRNDANATSRIVIFRDAELWRASQITTVPCGFYLRGTPQHATPDTLALLASHRDYINSVRDYLYTETPDTITLFATYRMALRSQLCYVGNELACLLVRQGHTSEAAELLTESAVLDSDNLSVLLNHYHLIADSNSNDGVVSLLKERLRVVPKRQNPHQLSVAVIQKHHGSLINTGTVEFAHKTFWCSDLPESGLLKERVQELRATSNKLIWYETAALLNEGELKEVRERLDDAISETPNDIRLWELLVELLVRTGGYEELKTRVYPAIRNAARGRDHYLLHLVQGHIAMQQGVVSYTTARDAFRRALQLNPNKVELREELLRIDAALDIPAFTEQDTREVLLANPDHPFANYVLGMAKLQLGDFNKAEDLFRHSLEYEESAGALVGLGATLLNRGESHEAERLVRHSLALESDNIHAQHTLARILLANGRIEEAVQVFAPVLVVQSESASVRLTQIRLWIAQQRIEEAVLMTSLMVESIHQQPPAMAAQIRALVQELSTRAIPQEL